MHILHKLIEVNDRYYLYITSTNHIYEISPETACIIPEYFSKIINSGNDNISLLKSMTSSPRVINEIENIVLPKRTAPTSLKQPYEREALNELINGGLHRLTIETTQDCNLRCSYCIYSGNYDRRRVHKKKKLSVDTAKTAVKYLVEHSKKRRELAKKYMFFDHFHKGKFDFPENLTISFYGGEPLLNFTLVQEVHDYAKEITKEPITFRITSNFAQIREDRLQYLVDNDFGITVSLDGPQSIHDRYRKYPNYKNTFNDVFFNIQRLISYAGKDYIERNFSFNVVLAYPQQWNEIVKFFEEEMTDYNSLNFMYLREGERESICNKNSINIQHITQQYRKLFRQGFEYISEQSNDRGKKGLVSRQLVAMAVDRIIGRKIFPDGFCEHPHSHSGPCFLADRLFLSADGNFYPCERVPLDVFCIGNPKDGLDIKAMMKLYKTHHEGLNDRCLSCWAYRLCALCIQEGMLEGYQVNKIELQKECIMMQDIIEKEIRTFCEMIQKDPGFAEKYDRMCV